MFLKDVDWSIMAQCDFYAVEKFVQTSDRPAMQTVAPMKEGIFQRKLFREEKWKNTYETICSAYESLQPQFRIEHDSFGGYRLLYTGKNSIQTSTVLKKNPIGFVKEVPEGVVTNLSVMSSERTGKQFLLLGPMRFVNSDCSPNCEYDFSSESGIVQLRVKKRINPGDEILVKYGPDFFEMNACRCKTCENRSKQETWETTVLDVLLYYVLLDLSEEVLNVERAKEVSESLTASKAKRRRIKGRELVEIFNELSESPPFEYNKPMLNSSAESSQESNSVECSQWQLMKTDHLNDTPRVVKENLQTFVGNDSFSDNQDNDDDDSDNEGDQTKSWVFSDENDLSDSEIAPENYDVDAIRASSPTHRAEAMSFSVSAIEEDIDYEMLNEKIDIADFSDKLFEGTETTVQEASDATDLLCSKYNLSDECSSSLHKLVQALLPVGNKFPSGSSYVRKLKRQFQDGIRSHQTTVKASVCVINFRFLIRDIVRQNMQQILN